MVTFQNMARVTAVSAMAGAQSSMSDYGLSGSMSRGDAQAMAIGKVAEANIIEPRTPKSGFGIMNQDRKKPGLDKQTYNALGRLGMSTAIKQAGGSNFGILNKIV